ncbi:unnamed protein product [Paramecium sonneborni]|uniref:Nudix hydrolase domain-containing protein n=1 Tax=Paramecium sonneborni TaxID=65129 RepID=A0A8S1KDP3_9CILI|nr:unnamed protein product [Paramecium sonneborni]
MIETKNDTITLAFTSPQNKCSIGVGAIIRKNNQILLVQEANGPARYSWAFPAGLLQENETIQAGIKREIQEEIGIDSLFKSIIFFGQQPLSRWGKQDFYFGCEVEIFQNDFKICQYELLDCKWWNIDQIHSLQLTPITRIGLPYIL